MNSPSPKGNLVVKVSKMELNNNTNETKTEGKRKRQDGAGSVESTPKKQKSEFNGIEDTNHSPNSNSGSEKENGLKISTKELSRTAKFEEALEAERQKQMHYLTSFVNVSMKYSTFLENKISTAAPSSSSDEDAPPSQVAIRDDIIHRLKYFKGELRPYQLEGVTWLTILFENSVNGILADEMGLGKTVQVIALFCHLYERKVTGPYLIVAPLSTLGNWKTEFARFAPTLPVIVFHGTADERKNQIKQMLDSMKRSIKPVIVTSYQIPLMEKDFFERITWQYIIVDEGHRLKNLNSQLSKELRSLKSINRTLLTGTPLQNDIQELWALLHFLMPQLFRDPQRFSMLIDLADVKNKRVLENEAKCQLVTNIHKTLSPFMLRREKKSVLSDIVPKKEVNVFCRLSEMQRYLYRATLQKDVAKLLMKDSDSLGDKRNRRAKRRFFDSLLDPTDTDGTSKRLVAYNKNLPFDYPETSYMCTLTMQNTMMMLRKVVSHPYLVWTPIKPDSGGRELLITPDLIKHSGKLQVLDAMLLKLKANKHKVLIFSTFVMLMDIIEEMLIMRNHKYKRLDGQTKFSQRNENIHQFNNDKEIFIFLVSTRAGGLGLNLTAADTVIFVDRDWNPMADLQAQDRCHRIGQTKPVMVYSLISKGTVDEVILARGEAKRLLEKIVIPEGKFQNIKKKFLSDEELEKLEEILNNEEQTEQVHPNGLMYSDEDLTKILDRSELFEEMQKMKK